MGKVAKRVATGTSLGIGAAAVLWADTRAARERLGFAPSVPFEQGVARFVAWLREASE